MSANKAKGTAAETAVVEFLRPWFPYVERRASNGVRDRGDIAGIPGVVIEVKCCARIDLAEWMDELEVEMAHAGAKTGFLVVKRRGKSSPGDWYWFATGPGAVELIREFAA